MLTHTHRSQSNQGLVRCQLSSLDRVDMSRDQQVRYAGLAVAVAGAVVAIALSSTVGFFVMICGFAISLWSRTLA
jgi:hypothetical protein